MCFVCTFVWDSVIMDYVLKTHSTNGPKTPHLEHIQSVEINLSNSPHFTTIQQCRLDNDFIQDGLKALFDESIFPDMQLLQESVKA
jgi:hypothetical protein